MMRRVLPFLAVLAALRCGVLARDAGTPPDLGPRADIIAETQAVAASMARLDRWLTPAGSLNNEAPRIAEIRNWQ